MSPFPIHRPRRLREKESIRNLIRETEVTVQDLVFPLFVTHGHKVRKPVGSMPGIFQLSVDNLAKEAQELVRLKIPAVILFGIPESKDAVGSSGYSEKSVVCQAIRAIKDAAPGLLVIADVCLCEYTDHGHCGVVVREKGEIRVENDATLELLSKMAGVFARAGADMVAPSDMMDGRVQKIRDELDAAGYKETPILSYAVKYASSFYGPFREAAESAPQFGDRRSYQMDPANVREAIREAELDLGEGADILMVKPALPYLDILKTLRERFSVPLAAYQVSGEYSMIKAAAEKGWIEEGRAVLESLISIKRAGADLILTYFAKDAAKLLG
jgi:porphobilinogen synthase